MAKEKKRGKTKRLFLLGVIGIALILCGFFFLHQNGNKETITSFTGTLPCADCSGLVTTLTIIKPSTMATQGTYILHELYEGKTPSPIVTHGTWQQTTGAPFDPNATIITTTEDDSLAVTNYWLRGSTLQMLDSQKQKIDSPFNQTLVEKKQATNNQKSSGLANPASGYCSKVGGTLTMQTRGDGGTYGLCTFEDNQACEEWALYRGQCPVGGVKTTGFDTVPQQYCAWVGGKTLAVENATCTLPSGKICEDNALYNGSCQ